MLDMIEIEDLDSAFKNVANMIGIDAYKKLIRGFGGTCIYVPVEKRVVLKNRNKIVKESFNGDYRETAMKYKLSETQVRRIVKDMK